MGRFCRQNQHARTNVGSFFFREGYASGLFAFQAKAWFNVLAAERFGKEIDQ